MSAVEALLNSPTDDIRDCPAITAADVRLVSLNLEVVLNKCLYCTRLKLPLPLEVLLTLVAEAGELQPEQVCAGLLHAAEEGTCLDVFCELASQLLSRKAAAFRLQFDVEVFFTVAQLFCCSPALKDRLGQGLGDVLLGYMRETELHADDYRVHRNCCSAVISLLRGSQANKAHFGPECAVIAACLEASSDFFFQMQCVEVLYRLYKHKSSYLTSVPASSSGSGGSGGMNPYLLRGIEELPNDSSLLLSIHQLLDNYNRDTHPDRIVSFPVLHMEVDGVEVSRATTLYFSPLLLVVLLPGSTGGYLTIPYEHVRSVKLSKDHKLELRLYIIPAKLSLVMSVDDGEGRDKLLVSMTRATMRELRTSVVHQWVAERKRSAPRRAVQLPKQPRPPQQQRTTGAHGSTTPAPTSAAAAAAAHGEAAATSSSSSLRAAQRPSQPASRTTSTPRPHIEERQLNVVVSGKGSAYVDATGNVRGSSAGHHIRSADTAGGPDDEETYLSEVHRAASVKAMRYRAEQQEHVQLAVDGVKAELEDLRRFSARERDQYETNFREDMEVVRRSEAVLKESAAECVQALNAELDDVQALGGLLKAEVDRLRERLAKSVGKSEGVEEAFLVRIKQSVDSSMRGMEGTLLAVDAVAGTSGQSMETVSQYIAHQMQAISSGALKPGMRQREGGLPQAVKTRRLN